MSCEGKWREYNDQLQATTNLPPGSADVASRCIRPECNRPLMKDGTCVMGHAQAPGEQPTLAPLLAALRCKLAEQAAAAAREAPHLFPQGEAPAQAPLPQTERAQVEQLLQANLFMDRLIPKPFGAFYADPRIQAATTFLANERLATAAQLAHSESPEAQLQAIQLCLETADWARQHHDTAAADRADRYREQLLPLTDLHHAAHVVAQQLNALAGGQAFAGDPALRPRILERADITLFPLPKDRLDIYPDEARDVLRRELGVVVAASEITKSQASIVIPSVAAIRFLQRRIKELEDAVSELETQPECLPVAAESWSPVQRVQQHALPLYQAAAQLQETNDLETMGAPGQALLQRLLVVKAYALQALAAVPPRDWPQALARLHFPPRVLALLKFRAVRAAVFNPENQVDLLGHLPEMAPQAVAALRACEILESLAQGGMLGDRRTTGPRNVRDVESLVRAGGLLAAAGDRSTPEEDPSAEDTFPHHTWWNAVGQLVDALSAHAPSTRTPYLAQAGAGRTRAYVGGTRLNQAHSIYNSIWEQGRDTRRFPTSTVRDWAVAAGMPAGRYAARHTILDWLQEGDPQKRLRITQDAIRWGLGGKSLRTLLAVDRTGRERTYKTGERVQLTVAGQPREGVVTGCILRSVGPEDAPTGINPVVEVTLQRGRKVTVPIAEIEVVKTKKK